MIQVNDMRPGVTFQESGQIYSVLDVSRNKTARSGMVIKLKVKNLRTGTYLELSYTGGDKVEPAMIEKKNMQYLYDGGDGLVFMDTATYEQLEIPKDKLEWEIKFLKENNEVTITMFESEILGVILPDKVALTVTQTEPAVKGDTANNAQKNATVETGHEIKVPLFIEEGEVVLVNTSDGKYSSRA